MIGRTGRKRIWSSWRFTLQVEGLNAAEKVLRPAYLLRSGDNPPRNVSGAIQVTPCHSLRKGISGKADLMVRGSSGNKGVGLFHGMKGAGELAGKEDVGEAATRQATHCTRTAPRIQLGRSVTGFVLLQESRNEGIGRRNVILFGVQGIFGADGYLAALALGRIAGASKVRRSVVLGDDCLAHGMGWVDVGLRDGGMD